MEVQGASARRAAERRRAAAGLVASLALHASLLAALLLGGRAQEGPQPPPRPITIVLAPAPAPDAPAPVAPGPGAAPGRADRAERARRRSRAGAGPAATAPSAPGGDGAPTLPELLGEGTGARRGRPSLLPELPAPGGPGSDAPAAPIGRGGLAPETEAEAAARGEARLDAWLADLKAVDRARHGPATYWSEHRAALGRGPAVAWDVLERGGAGDAVVSGARAWQFVAAWQRAAEAWATTGARGGDRGRTELSQAREALAARGLLAAPPPDDRLFVTELVTRVAVTFGDDGAVVELALAEGSGNAAYDRLVLARAEALRALAVTLGPPPGAERRTLWTVRTRFELVPPLPVVGCGFDATFKPTGCVYPLKKLVHTDVRLEAVWDGG